MMSRRLLHVLPALVALSLVAAFLACGRGDEGGAPTSPAPRGLEVSAVRDVARDLAFRREGGAWVAAGQGHRAGVDGSTWSFSTTGVTLAFGATRLARAGGAEPTAGGARAIDGELVEIDRGVARERLRNEAAGVEQSWSFDRAPAGEGDLVVRVPVSGAPLVASTAGGLHFGARGAGVRYGVATFVDAAGARTIVQPRFADGAIELRVPDGVLARAVFPAVLDPLIGGEADVDTPPTGVADVGSLGNDAPLAFDGTNWLVAWADDRGGRVGNIMATRIGPDGTPLDADDIFIAPGLRDPTAGDYASVAVAYDGADYLVVWTDFRAGNWDIYAARVSKAGVVLDPGGFPVSTAPNGQTSPAVAFDANDDEYMVVWSDLRSGSYQVYGSRVSVGGSVLNASGIPISSAPSTREPIPTIRFGTTQYLVAWQTVATNFGSIDAALLGPSGAVAKAFTIAQGVAQQHDYVFPSAAFGGGELLVAYLDDHVLAGSGPADVLATIVSTDGSLGATVTVGSESQRGALPSGARPPSFPTYPFNSPSAASDGAGFAVAFTDSMGTSARVQPIDLAGNLSGGALSVSGLRGPLASNAIAAGAPGTYAVAFIDYYYAPGGFGVDDAVVTFAADAGAAGATRRVTTSGANETTPSITFGNGQYLVTWSDARNAATDQNDVLGVFVDANGAVITPTPFAIGGPAQDNQLAPVAAFDGTRYLVCWDDQSSLQVDCQLVDGTGAPIGPVVLPTSGFVNGEDPRVSWDGQSFLVVWADPVQLGHRNIFGAHVADTGGGAQVLETAFTFPNVQSDFDVDLAHGAARDQLVTWVQGTNAVAATITPSFQGPGDSGPMSLTSIAGSKSGAAVAYDGTRWVTATVQSTTKNLIVARLDASGNVIGSEVPVPGAFAVSEQERATGTYDGVSTIFAWTELHDGSLDVYGMRVDPAGNVLDHFPIANDPQRDELAPHIASGGGGKSVVVYQRYDTQTNAFRASVRLLSEVSNQAIGAPCTATSECVGGATCVDSVCCASACNASDPLRCTACSVATGATADGTCTNVTNRVCRPAAGECDRAEICSGASATCPVDQSAPDGTLCAAGTCMSGVCTAVTVPDAGQDAAARDASAADASSDAPEDAPAEAAAPDASADAAPPSDAATDAAPPNDASTDAALPKDAGADAAPKPDAAPPADAGEDASPIVVLDSGRPSGGEDASITTFPPADEGCSCRVESTSSRTRFGGFAALAALAAAVAARRTRRSRAPSRRGPGCPARAHRGHERSRG